MGWFRWDFGRAVFLSFFIVKISSAGVVLDFQSIRAAIESSQSQIHDVESLLGWISRTHPDYLGGFTLMRQTHSEQEASSINPRAIVFGKDAKLILTFNGDPSQTGYDRVELIQFHEPDPISRKNASFEFREIRFTPTLKPGYQISPANPGLCLQCHQNPARPIWSSYDVWEGAYGRDDDALIDFDKDAPDNNIVRAHRAELADYRKFLAAKDLNPRYQMLRFPQGSPVSPYSTTSRSSHFELRPNLKLTGLIAGMQTDHILSIMKEDAACFDTYREILAATMMGCRRRDSNVDKMMQLLPIAQKTFERKYPGRVLAPSDEPYADDVLEDNRALLTLMGVEHSDVSFVEKPESWYFYVGEFTMRESIAKKLSEAILEEGKPRTDTSATSSYDPFGDACTSLLATAERKLAHAQPGACVESPAPSTDTAPMTIRMCLSCHSGKLSGVSWLPLDSPEDLLANIGLVEKIRRRIARAPGEPGAMPPTRPLSGREIRDLENYLKKGTL